MIVFKGVYHLRKHFENDINGDILFKRLSTGISNERLGLVYLKHFDRFISKLKIGVYRILIFDGYSSHLT